MSCHGCAKKFSLLTKEHGCPNCGFGYCSKCLDNAAFVQKLNKITKVCFRCKSLETKCDSSENVIEPPKAYLKMLETLENPSRPPITLYKTDDTRDRHIASRLEALKADKLPTSLPSESEIRERLANLRGEPIPSSSSSSLPPVDMRSDQQKADDLIKQYASQCQIEESHSSIDKEIEERLDKLRDKRAPAGGANVAELPQDEESKVARVIQQVLSMDIEEDELLMDDAELTDSEESLTEESHDSSDSGK